MAKYPGAVRIVADDEQIGLAAVEQRQRHRSIGRVKQRALAFDHVEMRRRRLR